MLKSVAVVPNAAHARIQVHHAASRIGCSPRTVRRFIQNGRLKAERCGKRAWGILLVDIELFCRRREELW